MTSLELQNRETELINILPYEFVSPEKTTERLRRIVSQLRGRLGKENARQSPKYIPLVIYCLALEAQIKILEYLNDGYLSCHVPWDKTTGLPSHPSMVADILKFTEVFEIPDQVRVLLESLNEWTPVQREVFLCCCGDKQRKVTLDIMINNALRVFDNRLVIKKITGIRSDDIDHLTKHYDFSQQSHVAKDIYKVWICENAIHVEDGQVEIEHICSECTEQFDDLMFSLQVWELLNQKPS